MASSQKLSRDRTMLRIVQRHAFYSIGQRRIMPLAGKRCDTVCRGETIRRISKAVTCGHDHADGTRSESSV